MAGNTFSDDAVTQNAFSFKITPKGTNKVQSSTPDNFNKKEHQLNHSEREDKEYIIAAEGKELKSLIQKKVSSKLVIPMILKNKWLNETPEEGGDNLSQQALNEILNDLNSEGESEMQDAAPIPLMMKNRLPPSRDGVMDERYDISIRPEESSIDDYKDIPVASFGSAMLRGMGWCERQPIGGVNKAVCEPIEYIPRHKGLGLGAEKTGGKQMNKKKRKLGECSNDDNKYKPIVENDGRVRHIKKVGEEVSTPIDGFIPGNRVIILKKPHKDLYGKIISVDEDTARISVKLSLSGEVIHLSQHNACVVDKTHTNTHKTDTATLNNNIINESNSENTSLMQKYTNENYSTCKRGQWLQSNIRVRIISRSFKGGKYYNKKAKIIDVVSIDTCTCKTEENKILDNVHEKYLETVVPKAKGSYVMILNGKYKGMHAKMLERKKVECLATVQLTSTKHITTASFDNIAEFTGELPDDEFL